MATFESMIKIGRRDIWPYYEGFLCMCLNWDDVVPIPCRDGVFVFIWTGITSISHFYKNNNYCKPHHAMLPW